MLDILIPAVFVTVAFGAGAATGWLHRGFAVTEALVRGDRWRDKTERTLKAHETLERKYLDLLGRAYVHDAKGRIKKASDVL